MFERTASCHRAPGGGCHPRGRGWYGRRSSSLERAAAGPCARRPRDVPRHHRNHGRQRADRADSLAWRQAGTPSRPRRRTGRAESPTRALESLASGPGVASVRLDRRVHGHDGADRRDDRRDVGPREPRARRRGRRRRDRRLRRHRVARRPRRRPGRPLRRLRRLSSPRRTTTTATARTSRASSPGNGYDSNGARRGIAPGRQPRRAEGARRRRVRLHQQRHRRARLRGRAPRAVQHPRHQPVGGGRRVRVLQHRSADARGPARRRRPASSSSPPRATSAATRRGRRSTAASPRPATHRGC